MYKTPNKYYEDNHKENSKLSFKAFQKRSEFWQGVLVASASLYGILVSLHDNFQEPLCTRVVFLCLTVVLTIGVSTAGVTLYNYAILLERHRQEVEKELLSALNKDALVSEVHRFIKEGGVCRMVGSVCIAKYTFSITRIHHPKNVRELTLSLSFHKGILQ